MTKETDILRGRGLDRAGGDEKIKNGQFLGSFWFNFNSGLVFITVIISIGLDDSSLAKATARSCKHGEGTSLTRQETRVVRQIGQAIDNQPDLLS